MNIFDELSARGIIAQCTDEDKVRELLNGDKPVAFYIGFDPTADSLHVGHFVTIMLLARLQRAGHIPIALFGGGTAMVGDPSGKSDMRKMLTCEEIDHNISCFRKQMSCFVDFSGEKAHIVNNADWLGKLNYIEFLREVGVHFSVNRMLAAECYKQRLEKGLSFFELNYMIMQSYDFLHLRREYDCILQLGGDDQWSNIIGGVELNRRMDGAESYGLTFKLLLTSAGEKMGKTVGGAVWLDPEKTSPYEFYQYWRDIDDADVINAMMMLTFLPVEQINEYAKRTGSELNEVKEIFALEITTLVHGEEEAKKAQQAARALFTGGGDDTNIPSSTLTEDDLTDGAVNILDLLIITKLAPSKAEARRLVQQGGVSVDGEKITSFDYSLSGEKLAQGVLLKKGKKVFHKVLLV
ncbi:MAG: tyrosine--tRNA ligase [Oscillospiraceae bacterium]|nr:tyrosine--tRNA ligase [Oscillospiraceae bacterium]